MRTERGVGSKTQPGENSLEGIVLWSAACAQVVLRILYTFHHRADWDESQHLHVVWGWTQGLVQYRDVFDNHAPLFHLTMAPFIAWLGERPDILIFARWLMVPLVALTLWATYRLGRDLWSPRVGLWAAVLTGLTPCFLLTSTEFRADVMWMAGWLSTLLVLLGGRLTRTRAALAGLLLGATLATSLKTILLVVALGMALALTKALLALPRGRLSPTRDWQALGWLVAGAAIVPIATVGVFWRLNALRSMIYCTVAHQLVPGLGLWHSAPQRMLIFPIALLGLGTFAHALLRKPGTGARPRQVIVMLSTGFYLALLESFWPLITKQDFLASTPLVVMLIVAGVLAGLAMLERAWPRVAFNRIGRLILASYLLIDIVAVNRTQRAWREANQAENQLLREVVRDTRPGEPIMDLAGETVFRPRAHYYVLENVTAARLAKGLLDDTIAIDVARARAHFAVSDSRFFPPAGRRFLNEHFVSVGSLRVLGKDLCEAPGPEGSDRTFDVSYPERFAMIADRGAACGTLDGVPYRGPTSLAPGPHTYRPRPGEKRVVVVWEGALERNLISATGGRSHPVSEL